MATLAQLQAQEADLRDRIRAITQRIREATSDAEGNRLLEERQQLRNGLQEVTRQIDRIEVSAATGFVASIDDNTGLVVIRTSNGLLAGRGNTLADAKEAAIRFNGASPAALQNLTDPLANSPAPPVSTGTVVAEEQQAQSNGAETQNPPAAAETVAGNGAVSTAATTTVPSNAEVSSEEGAGAPSAAPEKLPPGTVGTTGNVDSTAGAATSTGNQSPTPANQRGGVNLDTPDENNNRVSYIYRAYQVTSSFRQGRFIQDIEGAQIFFPIAAQSAVLPAQVREPAAATEPAPQSGSVQQGTVGKSATTPGATSLVGFQKPPELPTLPGVNKNIPSASSLQTSVFEFQGFDNPIIDQISTVAPLTSLPTSVPTASELAQGAAATAAVQKQLTQAQLSQTQAQRALATVEARIARGEGNQIENLAMRNLYASNLARATSAVTALEQQAQQSPTPSAPNTNVAPQQGAKEY